MCGRGISFGDLGRTVGLRGGVGGAERRVVLQLTVDTQDYWKRAQVYVKSGKIGLVRMNAI